MVWWLLLPIIATPLTYLFGGLVAMFFATFFLKLIIQVAFILIGLYLIINYAKHSHEYKGKSGRLIVLLGIGFLISSFFINSIGSFIGFSYAPILSYSTTMGIGSIASGSGSVLSSVDIGLLFAFILSLWFSFSSGGQKFVKKIRKKL